MEIIKDLLNLLDGYLGAATYFPFALLGTGLFLTIYLRFPQIRFFSHAWRVLMGKYDKPGAEGDATHFQALSTAISGTVGTGNIGGVALAIYLGGPAALFWMWMTAFLGMTSKFVEVSLSHKYREKDADGHISGGPMYVMEKRLNMKWLAVFFALATVVSSFGTGSLPQSNSIANGVEASFGVPVWLTGGVLALLLAFVIIGGISRIIKVAEKIVPLMAVFYLLGALTVILYNFDQIIPSFIAVFRDAFTGSAASGGFLGASFAYAFNRGVNRGLFSNEAGQGSAPIAHAAAKTDEPVAEGMIAILEPFIDTIIICSVTGLVILASGVWTEKIHTDFQQFDTEVIAGVYHETNPEQRQALYQHLSFTQSSDPIKPYSGQIEVVNGKAVSDRFTIIHNRSVAEDVEYSVAGEPFTGQLMVNDGAIKTEVKLHGKSLIHSVDLTMEAFSRGYLGDYGRYVVSIGLVLFAFTTAVAWSYYGDRAMTYLFGTASVLPYRVIYVSGFFIAAVADTSLIWLMSAISIALMTLPNLLTMLWLHKEMKQDVDQYWQQVKAPEAEN
ncbi:MAG: sodium:alanine symporter family protein [Pseudomonadales bacterium]|nr:sodium:alanine symporter family protein [Pseudomonadales bacterium]